MTRIVVVALVASLYAQAMHAQTPPEYGVPIAPLYWVSDNPFHLHLVRAGDTIGEPVRAISVFRETWSRTAEGFDVERASADLGFSTRARIDTLSVTTRGQVIKINRALSYEEGEWDALLRLPAEPLRVGLEWADTLNHPTSGPLPGFYEVRRSYRVERQLASEDSSGFEVSSRGSIRFTMSMWTDSATGSYRWFELEGPVDETFVFDPETGELHRRIWSMRLEGIGGDADRSGTDTVPAVLRSENSRYRIPSARATSLMRPLPGPDTAVTIRGEDLLFAHTLGADAAQISEGFRRADGMVGQATVTMEGGQARSWEFLWVDLLTDPRTILLVHNEDGLIRGTQRLEPPTQHWGVAEYGMPGSLVPSLQKLPDQVQTEFAIYRPIPAKWDVVTVTKRTLAQVDLFILVTDTGEQTAMIFDRDGALLFSETTTSAGERTLRVPTTTARRAQLESVLREISAGI